MKLQLVLADPQITVIDDLGNRVAAVFELVLDQARLSVLHFVDGRRFLGSGFDVGEAIVVIDRRHAEWILLGRRILVVVLDRFRVRSPKRSTILIELLPVGRLCCGELRLGLFRLLLIDRDRIGADEARLVFHRHDGACIG